MNTPENKKTARKLRNHPVLSNQYIENKINFQNYYLKLGYDISKPSPNNTISRFATLIQVIRINKSELSESFIEYDTKFIGGSFQIPDNEELLLLIFKEQFFCKIFTTLRSYTKRKESFYRKRVGQPFEILVGLE
ncbi:hypothetical protein [Leptospira bouyouniensis]|uniref:DUF1564 family protein n=1 Tax=Leptospira bouyouniensis TaxID=2484911 RepID=A0ABY2L984_9LEPT|nr:hypothetical protein [Leptospira bouyouniensis]TGK53219.1 hypothetical protein EHQ10_05620 [Leptospira bouyouniensis]